MTELPVFLSYRRQDGTALAVAVHDALRGGSVFVPDGTLFTPATLAVYFDQTAAAVSDWAQQNQRALEEARVLIVICTPGTVEPTGPNDHFFAEIEWWLQHRPSVPPILVSAPGGRRCVPSIIRTRWPKAQVVPLPSTDASDDGTPAFARGLLALRAGIRLVVGGDEPDSLSSLARNAGLTTFPGLYAWEKDRSFRYIWVNENYCRAAGFLSPHEMLGKTDDDMPWRSLADFFRRGDQRVIDGVGPPRYNVQEREIMVDRVADILVTERPLCDRRGDCVAVQGFFVDVTGHTLVPDGGGGTEAGLKLGPTLGNEELTPLEVVVLKGLLQRMPIEQIAERARISRATAEAHHRSLKLKLQCVTDGDVVAAAMREGLPLRIFGLTKR